MKRIAAKLEQLLGVNLSYVAKGGFFLSLSQVASALLALATTAAFANLVSPEVFGTYKYVISVYGILSLAALPGVETAIIQSVSRGFDSSFLEGAKIKIRWGLLGFLGGSLVSLYYALNGNRELSMLFLLAGIMVPLFETANLYSTFLNGKKLFKQWTAMDIGLQAAGAVSLVLTMLATRETFPLLLAYFIPQVIVGGAYILWIRSRLSEKASHDPELHAYSKALSLFQIIAQVATSIDQIVLFQLLGAREVALFALASAIPTRMQSFFKISSTLTLPVYADRDPREIARALPRKLAIFAVGIIVACIAYALLAPLLFRFIFPKYLPAITYSQAYAFFTLSAITYPLGSLLYAHKKVRENYWISLSAITVKIAVLIFLVPIWGVWGAVIGVLAHAATVTTISTFFLRKIGWGTSPDA